KEPAAVEQFEAHPETVVATNDGPNESPADVQAGARSVEVKAPARPKNTRTVKRAVNRSTSAPPAIAINAQAEEPRLNEFDDLEGDGLRLADLVADLDSE